MTPMQLQDAIGNIDDAFIDEAASDVVLRVKTWMPAAALAACILLTVALVPWKTLFSENDPSDTDSSKTDTVVGVLQNNDTTSFDTTIEQDSTHVIVPDDSTQSVTDDTSSSNQISTLPTDPAPDTTGPAADHVPNEKDEETTGPLVSDEPNTPDNGAPLPLYPTVLSHSSYPVQEQYPAELSLRPQWRSAKNERIYSYQSGVGETESFIYHTLSEFFSNSKNENMIYSPVNAYMSLGMLTEATSGSSRQQLLGLLGQKDVYSLRTSAFNLWNSCYRDDGIVTAVLANSLWFDNSFSPKQSVADILAENYYASSFYGNVGEDDYDALMREWLNEQTKGMIKDTVANEALDPESVVSLISTVYFKADWAEKFDTEVTRTSVFHSPEGDVTAQFMYRDFVGLRYVGKNFETTYLELEEGGEMWFILPDEGVSLQSLFSDREAMGFITGNTQKTLNKKDYNEYMWLFLPKFDINSRIDLRDGLNNIGITEVFDKDCADFSSLTDSRIFINGITQSVRLSVDENGCEAVSVSTDVLPGDGGSVTNGFKLNRPFIFVVTSDTGLPLFVGTVNHPN